MFNKRTKIKALLESDNANFETTVMGWVRSFRNNQFIALNDGSTNNNLQVVAELGSFDDSLVKRLTSGACIKATGQIVESLGKGQKIELKASSLEILGECDPLNYPLQLKNKPTLEYLREKAHLRFRTNTFGAIFRVRHSLAFAIHKFFNERGFVYLHTPIITGSDAEGAGEMFRVTTLPIKNMPLVNKQLDKLAIDYYSLIISKLKEQGFEIDILNQEIKILTKNEWDFNKIIIANDGKLRELRKLKGLFNSNSVISNLFLKAYALLKDSLYHETESGDFYGSLFIDILPSTKKYKVSRRMGRENYPF